MISDPHAKTRVVIADDTPAIRELLRVCLDMDGGFEVVGEAGDGANAVRVCEEKAPDLVLLDLAMPVMDGLEATRRIREQLPGVRIIILSGFDEAKMSNEALRRGADAYIPKGTSPEEIIKRLRDVAADSAGAGPVISRRQHVPSRDQRLRNAGS